MKPAIHFYRAEEKPYGCFSNYYKGYPIEIDGKLWPTVEHYYQAMKFQFHPNIQESIRNLKRTGDAWKIGNSSKMMFDTNDWDARRDMVMLNALRAKFTQHAELRKVLLSTYNRHIVEHTPNDHYWADGGDGSGRNQLGKFLMQVRYELREMR